jgi:alkanesulfonate monooxygenase SsuD/methylene tetrahydromethanopterin reductase-like flavin-dependent oxidoreductase (luciferase family)
MLGEAMPPANAVPRVGVLFRPQFPPEQLRGFVRAAEAAGLDDVWLWEDCVMEGGLTSAAACLAWTTSLRVGLGLMPVPFRNAALAAMEIATLARLFPDRFVPAAGHGVPRWMAQVGAGAASPMTLLAEWVSATRALLNAETVTVDGVYVRLDEVVYLPSGTGPGARQRLEAELDPSRGFSPLRVAVGSPGDVAHSVRAFAAAGATTVVLQPTGDEPDIGSTLRLAEEAQTIIRGVPACRQIEEGPDGAR